MQLRMTQNDADVMYNWRGTDQGLKLKSGGGSGLNIPLSGYRGTEGLFWGIGSSEGHLWSSTRSSTFVWSRYLHSSYSSIYRDYTNATNSGFSIRCIGN